MGRNTRMQQWIDYRVRVTVDDSRMFVGVFMAFDRHMNIALADAEEFRKIKSRTNQEEREVKRIIGFILIRGDSVISITVEAPPAPEHKKQDSVQLLLNKNGIGTQVKSSNVLSMGAPFGLEGPVRGIGINIANDISLAGVPQF